MTKKTTTKAAPKKAAPKETKAAEPKFNMDACQHLANEVNRIHGAGPQCSVAFNEVTLIPLAGIISTTADVPGYFLLPARDRWDGQITAGELYEELN